MRYTPRPPDVPDDAHQSPPLVSHPHQLYDAFLVLDVEATCFQGTGFDYPNEIIEFPICLMKWRDSDCTMKTSNLQVVNEFRSFVRPSWRPILSNFCTELTGITQEQVDAAPPFPQVLESVRAFLVENGLIDNLTGKRLVRFCWCSDGPFDVRDFVVKQCFISKIPMPEWLRGDILDVRMSVMQLLNTHSAAAPSGSAKASIPPVRRSLNIPAQLKALGLPTFQGRQHSGIDDTRNIAKIVTELSKRGAVLRPNTQIKPGRKWIWMGKGGQVLEQFCASFDENGNLATLPSPSPDHGWGYSTTPQQPGPTTSSAGSDSESSRSGSDSGSASGSPSSYASVVSGRLGQVYGFGTATRPDSPAFWSPPPRLGLDSTMSIVSFPSSSESELQSGMRNTKPRRLRWGHKRFATAGPITVSIGTGPGVGIDAGVVTATVTAACVS